jgi:hypothetical protein
LKVCYEAGPTGHALYWELTRLGVQCEVIALSRVSTKAGECIKTERRDAEKLARSYREPSARQLPTTDDHEGAFGRSSNSSLSNRR